ncbi:MAG: hypothetical protein KF788_05775 [Piscinibacter sp.]|nr:hypothetical protein [Piscinibacter sp.]
MDSGIFLSAKLLAVPALFTLVLTLLFAPLLLALYRWRVAALMMRGTGGTWGSEAAPAAAGAPAWQVVELARGQRSGSGDGPWHAAALRGRLRIACAYGAGGAAAGLGLSTAFAIAYADQLSATALLAALVVFMLPAAATLLQWLVVAPLRRAALFAAVLVMAWLAAGIARGLGQTLFEAFVLIPAVLLFVFSLRLWRAVAPLLLPIMAGASLLWVIGAELGRDGGPMLLWGLRLAGFALGAGAGLLALKLLQSRLDAARLGDQQLFVDAWWLIYTVYCTVVFVMMKRDPAGFAVLGVFVIYLLAKRAVHALWPRQPAAAPSLLLLRVFDQGGRTERLFAQLEQDWRLVGPIALIAGRDLALRNVAAADFVAFVTGRLQRRFVADAAALQRRLAVDAARPDPDGRFAVDHYWCHADTWRPVMRALVARSDVVLMDLRGFDTDRAGCAYELGHLAATARDKPVLLVVSEAREAEAVHGLVGARESAQAAWRLLRVAPDATDLAPAVFAALGHDRLVPRQA